MGIVFQCLIVACTIGASIYILLVWQIYEPYALKMGVGMPSTGSPQVFLRLRWRQPDFSSLHAQPGPISVGLYPRLGLGFFPLVFFWCAPPPPFTDRTNCLPD
ncbi:uncharacterized protein BJX67DRAFT_360323 [Aspergillus lucknowensis]|uniref:Uncharacterized protein n=1 Tax=Aspergillus lucknowensis TaxID=176173 RepID=A0ABR4LJT5_9EURO